MQLCTHTMSSALALTDAQLLQSIRPAYEPFTLRTILLKLGLPKSRQRSVLDRLQELSGDIKTNRLIETHVYLGSSKSVKVFYRLPEPVQCFRCEPLQRRVDQLEQSLQRWQAMVDSGRDALEAEQNRNKQLREELDNWQSRLRDTARQENVTHDKLRRARDVIVRLKKKRKRVDDDDVVSLE